MVREGLMYVVKSFIAPKQTRRLYAMIITEINGEL